MARIEAITGNERRRKWTIEDKQAILAEAFASGASPIEVARRADISTGQLYTWRKELWKPAPPPAFAQVVTLPDRVAEPDADRFDGRHVIPRGLSGSELLAMMLLEKYGQHQPLNRQSERYAREGIDLSVSTLADHVGACTSVLRPVHQRIQAHVLAAERLHGDDTTVPVLAKGKTVTGRLWTYVRDDRPFAGRAPPAAIYYYSPDRSGAHPQAHLAGWRGVLQADAYSGYNDLFEADREGGAVTSAFCMAHAAATSSNSPISRAQNARAPKARKRRPSRRWRSKP